MLEPICSLYLIPIKFCFCFNLLWGYNLLVTMATTGSRGSRVNTQSWSVSRGPLGKKKKKKKKKTRVAQIRWNVIIIIIIIKILSIKHNKQILSLQSYCHRAVLEVQNTGAQIAQPWALDKPAKKKNQLRKEASTMEKKNYNDTHDNCCCCSRCPGGHYLYQNLAWCRCGKKRISHVFVFFFWRRGYPGLLHHYQYNFFFLFYF